MRLWQLTLRLPRLLSDIYWTKSRPELGPLGLFALWKLLLWGEGRWIPKALCTLEVVVQDTPYDLGIALWRRLKKSDEKKGYKTPTDY